jgi:serine/threonine protein kinase
MSASEPTLELTDNVKAFLTEKGLEVMDYLDRGTTAVVFSARMTDIDSETKERQEVVVAVKWIDLEKLEVKHKKKYIPREKAIVNTVRHEYIIKTHKILELEDRYVFIVTDLADSDLISVLAKGEHLDLQLVKQWFRQIVWAVEYLHGVGIAHRDLKADNVLIRNNSMKVTDFGYAREIPLAEDGTRKKCRSNCGTIEYQSPEALLPVHWFDPFVSDCFSLGVLLYTMTTLKFPFGSGEKYRSNEGRERLKQKIIDKDWDLPESLQNDERLYSLLKQLLNPDPSERIRSSQILSHPWLKS